MTVDVSPEGIPALLTDRDQWIVWHVACRECHTDHPLDAETCSTEGCDGEPSKVPVDPATGYNASSTDPDTWASFEDALAYHRREDTHTHGVGYVFDAEGMLVGLDLDNVRDPETGALEPWAEDVVDRLDSFTEISVSGTGLHVYVLGLKPGDVCREGQASTLECFESSELECYDESRYFAVTGERLDDTPADINERNTTLSAIYDEYLADDVEADTEADTAPTPTTDLDDEELIEKAKNAENGDQFERLWNGSTAGYESQSEADLALCSHLAFWTGGDTHQMDALFRESGLMREKWDEDRGSQTYGERTIETALDGRTDFYDPSEGGGQDGPALDSTSDFDEDELERGEAILQSQTAPDEPVGDLEFNNGGYAVHYENRDSDGNVVSSGYDQVTNFTLETLSFLETEERRSDEFVVRVHPNHPTEEPYDVRVAPAVFNSAEKFRDEIVLGRTTWFDPSNRTGVRTVTLLRNLRETVGAQPAPHRKGQPFIGLSEDYTEFVTPEGSLTADGWTDDPEFEFYSKGSGRDGGALGDKWLLDPEEEIDADEDAVARICELLWQTRKPERGLPMLGWFYAAPIKALIHEWESEFPILSPHGDTGTGKTATLETFCRVFGLTGEPLSATDTRFTIQKHISESRGAPVWFDEYKPTEMSESMLDHLHQRLKEVTKERTLSKGTPDLDMIQLHMRAPVVLSGEQKVSDPAVRRRTILTNLSREPTRAGTDTKAAFGELTGTAYEDSEGTQHYPEGYDLRQHARAFYEWVLDYGVENLQADWNGARERVKEVLADYGITVEASEERGLQTIIFGVALYREFATDFGADADTLPDDEHVREACLHVVENIGKGGQRREHADEFLELCALAAADDYLEPGVHHRLLESQKHGCEVLALHMPTVFSTVKRYVRDTNLEGEYNVLSKTDYLNSFGNKADAEDTYVLATNVRTRGVENGKRTVQFHHEAITDKLGGDFNVDAFREVEERDDRAAEGGDDDHDGDGVLSLTEIGDAHKGEYVTVEATAASVVDPRPWFQAEGTLEADGVVMDYVARGDSSPTDFSQGTTYRIERAKVTDSDGALCLEIRDGVTTVSELSASPSDGDQTGLPDADAAADGGVEEQTDGPEGPLSSVAEALRTDFESGEAVSPASLAGALDEDPAAVEEALATLARKEQRVQETADGYEVR